MCHSERGRFALILTLLLGGVAPGARAQDAIRDVGVTATAAPSPATVGSNVTYSIAVAIPAGGASGVTITDILPSSVTYVSGSPSCSNNQGTVSCSMGTLAAGTATATIVASRISIS